MVYGNVDRKLKFRLNESDIKPHSTLGNTTKMINGYIDENLKAYIN